MTRNDPARDLLGTAATARRIAAHLFDTPLRAVGLMGPWGSGKTSLLRFVEYFVRESDAGSNDPRRPRTWTCSVDAWGLGSGSSAAEYVLARVVGEISKHVDCMAIQDLPAHYREALKGSGSPWLKIVGALFTRLRSPLDSLQELEPILEASNARLVIFVEDLDRNHDERVSQEIEAMLDRLRHVRWITFVLAMSDTTLGGAMEDHGNEH